MYGRNSAPSIIFPDREIAPAGFELFKNPETGNLHPHIRRILIGAGAGTVGGFGGRLALSHYFPNVSLGAVPELAGAIGGAYLAHTLSGRSDKKNSARLLYLDSLSK